MFVSGLGFLSVGNETVAEASEWKNYLVPPI